MASSHFWSVHVLTVHDEVQGQAIGGLPLPPDDTGVTFEACLASSQEVPDQGLRPKPALVWTS